MELYFYYIKSDYINYLKQQAKKTYDRVVNKVSVELTRNACDFKLAVEQILNNLGNGNNLIK